jgi:hypothetical protein
MIAALEPHDVRPRQWRQAADVAREACARFFKDGRSPADAMRAYGLAASGAADWTQAVNVLVELHCANRDAKRVA